MTFAAPQTHPSSSCLRLPGPYTCLCVILLCGWVGLQRVNAFIAVFPDGEARGPIADLTTIPKGANHAQNGEDVRAYERYFYKKTDGIILESGALDGDRFSTSFLFEQAYNWSALHIEADPVNFRNLKHNRPLAVNIHAALCSTQEMVHWLGGPKSKENAVNGIFEFMTEEYKQTFWPNTITMPLEQAYPGQVQRVSCSPITNILKALKVTYVDIWVLDIEGAELNALQGVDFDYVKFGLIIMECDKSDVAKNEAKKDILANHGYMCGATPELNSCWCPHKDLVPSRKP